MIRDGLVIHKVVQGDVPSRLSPDYISANETITQKR